MAPINVAEAIKNAFLDHKIVDIHTHLYPAEMGPMYLAGPDELITYHYLKAETSRHLPLTEVEGFNNLPTDQQADVVWKTLFTGDSSPISEAQVGVVTVMWGRPGGPPGARPAAGGPALVLCTH